MLHPSLDLALQGGQEQPARAAAALARRLDDGLMEAGVAAHQGRRSLRVPRPAARMPAWILGSGGGDGVERIAGRRPVDLHAKGLVEPVEARDLEEDRLDR